MKTPDEIELLKISSSLGDAAMWKIQNEWLKPGIREADITAKDAATQLAQATSSQVVQVIGRTATFFRENPDLRNEGVDRPWQQ